MIGLLGILVLLGIGYALSSAPRAIQAGRAGRALALQVGIAALALLTPVGTGALAAMNAGVTEAIGFAAAGAGFVFGPLADPSAGLIVAFQILPVIVFVAAVLSVLFHLGVMDVVIRYIGGGLQAVTGASRLEATCAAANVFVGMAEAPLTVRPYLETMTRAQLFTVMSLGLASVAGTVLVAYASLGVRSDLLLTAAFMAPAGGLLFGGLLVPETETPVDIAPGETVRHGRKDSIVEALTDGALTGLQIMLAVIAVLIAFVAVIAMINGLLDGAGGLVGLDGLSLERLFGWGFAPIAFLIGVPWAEAAQAGTYLGQKVVLNEFLAYAAFAGDIDTISAEGQRAITVALCGFANLGGLAILIAGLGAVVPARRAEISKLGLRAVLAGTLSNFTSAAIVSVLFAVQSLWA